MTRATDVLVVGGGIAGLTTALAAARAGLTVTVIDSVRPGAASRAAAGMLAPSVEGLSDAVRSIAMDARDFYPPFLAALRQQVGVEVPLDRNGILQLADTAEALGLLAQSAGPSARVLDAGALVHLEPAFAGHPGAVLHPLDGAVDNVLLMRALDLAVEAEPRIARVIDSVTQVSFPGAMAALVTAAGARLESPHLVHAGGAWAASLQGLPRILPVRPLRGQLLRLGRVPIRHVTYGAGGYLVPRGDTLLIGATSDDAGFVNEVTAQGQAALRVIASRAIPSLADAPVVHHWAGLRPVTPDALPIIGPDPELPHLIYACGFSRNGILLAPWAAVRLASVLSGASAPEELAHFAVARFDNRRNLTS